MAVGEARVIAIEQRLAERISHVLVVVEAAVESFSLFGGQQGQQVLVEIGADELSAALREAGIVELLEDPARAAKKIKSAVTDTGREIIFDPEAKPGVSNLLTIYSALSGRPIDELVIAYEGKGYGDLKKDLAEVVAEFLRPIQQRTSTYLDDPAQLDKLLGVGAEKARAVAAPTLKTVYDRIGFLAPVSGH